MENKNNESKIIKTLTKDFTNYPKYHSRYTYNYYFFDLFLDILSLIFAKLRGESTTVIKNKIKTNFKYDLRFLILGIFVIILVMIIFILFSLFYSFIFN